jgi:hypothetical protein
MNNGLSVDQVVANTIAAGPNPTTLHSLQLGLSTVDSFTDGLAPAHSRSMSWKSASEPLYKTISPQAVLDRLLSAKGSSPPSAGTNTTPTPDPVAERRRALRKSALDYIIESSTALQMRLSASDVKRMDSFLSSVRSLEKRVSQAGMPVQTPEVLHVARAALAGLRRGQQRQLRQAAARVAHDGPHDDGAHVRHHARVVSYMLDDARSEFVYKFLRQRQFTPAGSTPGTGGCDQYHAMQHAGETNNQFATIGWWMAQKANELATKIGRRVRRRGGVDAGQQRDHLRERHARRQPQGRGHPRGRHWQRRRRAEAGHLPAVRVGAADRRPAPHGHAKGVRVRGDVVRGQHADHP